MAANYERAAYFLGYLTFTVSHSDGALSTGNITCFFEKVLQAALVPADPPATDLLCPLPMAAASRRRSAANSLRGVRSPGSNRRCGQGRRFRANRRVTLDVFSDDPDYLAIGREKSRQLWDMVEP
jgi:hypothetical protein